MAWSNAFRRFFEARWALWLTLLLVPRVFFYFQYDFLNVDEGAHLLGAKALLQSSSSLYTSFVDNKPPLIYFLYALPLTLAPAGWEMTAVHWFFCLAVTLPTVWGLSHCFASRNQGTLAGAFYLLSSTAFVAADSLAANTEQAMLLPLSWAVAAALSPHFSNSGLLQFATGLGLGLAVLGKQPALLAAGAFLAAPSSSPCGDFRASLRRRAHMACLFALGIVTVFGALALWGIHGGTWAAAWYWIVDYNFQHVAPEVTLTDFLVQARNMLLPLVAAWLPAVVLTGPTLGTAEPRRTFLSLLFFTLLVPAFLGARFFGHYFLPALYGSTLLLFSAGRLPRWAWIYVCLSALGFTAANVFITRPSGKMMDVTLDVQESVGQIVRQSPCEGSLFVWGYSPTIYHYSGRAPASRFVLPIDTISGYVSGNLAYERGDVEPAERIVPGHRKQLLMDLRRSPPSHIVDTSGSPDLRWQRHPLSQFPELAAFVQDGYEVLAEEGGVRIYSSSGCDPRP